MDGMVSVAVCGRVSQLAKIVEAVSLLSKDPGFASRKFGSMTRQLVEGILVDKRDLFTF